MLHNTYKTKKLTHMFLLLMVLGNAFMVTPLVHASFFFPRGTENNAQTRAEELCNAIRYDKKNKLELVTADEVSAPDKDAGGVTPLMLAIHWNNDVAVTAILKKIDTADAMLQKDAIGSNNALMYAARSGNISIIIALLAKNQSINSAMLKTRNADGNTALMIAIINGHEQAALLLLTSCLQQENKLDLIKINNRINGNTALSCAREHMPQNSEVTRLLADHLAQQQRTAENAAVAAEEVVVAPVGQIERWLRLGEGIYKLLTDPPTLYARASN